LNLNPNYHIKRTVLWEQQQFYHPHHQVILPKTQPLLLYLKNRPNLNGVLRQVRNPRNHILFKVEGRDLLDLLILLLLNLRPNRDQTGIRGNHKHLRRHQRLRKLDRRNQKKHHNLESGRKLKSARLDWVVWQIESRA
jgi:hypothetical protein